MYRRKTILSAGPILVLISAAALAAATGEAAAEQRVRSRTTAQAGNPAIDEGDQTDLLSHPVTLDLVDAPLESALEAIAQRAGLALAYNPDILPAGRTVTLRASALPARDALARVLNETRLEATITRSGQLTFAPQSDPPADRREAAKAGSQQALVTGTVSDARTGEPLRGAQVRVDESELSTITDGEGRYTLEDVPPGTYTLIASVIGYGVGHQQVTVAAGTSATADFALTVSAVPLDEMIVTGTMVPTQMRAVPSPVTVITAEEIERKGIVRFEDVLRSVPGVGVVSRGGQDYLSVLYVRGANSFLSSQSTIKTYIDGVEVANAVYTLNQIDPASIERIELLRGPQASTLHGSEAIAGVLQIFTKKGHVGAQRRRLEATIMGGGLQSEYIDGLAPVQSDRITLTGGEQNLSYRLGASYSYTGEWVEDELIDELGWDIDNSVVKDLGLSGGFRYVTGPLTADFSARVVNRWSNSPLDRAVADPARSGRWNRPYYTKPNGLDLDFDFRTYGLSFNYSATPRWQHSVTLGQDRAALEFSTPQARRTTPADTLLLYQSLDWDRSSIAYSTALKLPLLPHTSASVQAGFDRSTFIQRTALTRSATRLNGGLENEAANLTRGILTNHGFFLQTQTDWRDQIFITAGLRADNSSGFGDDYGYAWSPRAGVAHVLNIGAVTVKSRASYGTAIRPPDPEQKLGQTLGNFVTLANDQLAPEVQSGYDFGLDVYVGPRVSVSVTRYDQVAKDLIAIVHLSDPTDVPRVQQYQNVGRITNAGWELEGTIRPGPATLTGQYTLMESTVEQLSPTYTGTDFVVGEGPLNAPRRSGALSATYSAPRATVTVGMSYKGSWRAYRWVRYYEAIYGTDPNREPYTGSRGDYVEEYPAVYRYELNAAYDITPKLEALLTIDNLLNDSKPDQWDLSLVRGRQVTVGLRLDTNL